MRKCAAFSIVEGVAGQGDKILLVQDKTNKYPKFWKLPGGKSEKEEFAELVLLREIHEELKIVICQPLDTDVIFKKSETDHDFYVYRTRYYSGEVSIGEGIEKISFFSRDDVKKMIISSEILPKHAMALTKYIFAL